MDTFVLLKILSMHNGCKENDKIMKLKSNDALGDSIDMPKSNEQKTED